MASEWEARDALGVESDVWKSKYLILVLSQNFGQWLNQAFISRSAHNNCFLRYLASSVIVEELEKSRQEASARAGKSQL